MAPFQFRTHTPSPPLGEPEHIPTHALSTHSIACHRLAPTCSCIPPKFQPKLNPVLRPLTPYVFLIHLADRSPPLFVHSTPQVPHVGYDYLQASVALDEPAVVTWLAVPARFNATVEVVNATCGLNVVGAPEWAIVPEQDRRVVEVGTELMEVELGRVEGLGQDMVYEVYFIGRGREGSGGVRLSLV